MKVHYNELVGKTTFFVKTDILVKICKNFNALSAVFEFWTNA